MAFRKWHIIYRFVQGLVIAFVLIQLVACILFQIPSVQTDTAKFVAEKVNGKINGDISIGTVSFVFFNRLVLRDVTVCGRGAPAPWGDSDTCLFHNPGDTLGHVGKLSVSFTIRDFIMKKIGARRVVLEDSFFYLLTEGADMSSNLTRIFGLPLPDPDKEHPVFPDIFATDIRLKNCAFHLGNPYVPNAKDPEPGQMLYNNLKIEDITAHFKDFKTINGEINCRILSISAVESSGAGIEKMSGRLHLGPRGSGMDDMYLKDVNGTELKADHLYFNYSSKEEIADWVDSVVMDVKFRETTFTFNSLRYFVPSMVNNHLTLTISEGYVTGPVSDINARGMKVSFTGGNSTVTVDAVVRGIPDMPNTYLDGQITDVISARDLSAILTQWSGQPAPKALSQLAVGKSFYQNVRFKGPFKNLNVSGSLKLNYGSLKHNVAISLFTPLGFTAGGTVEADSLDLGFMLGNGILGKSDFKLKGEFASGKHTSAVIEYFNIDRIGLLDYDYRGLSLSGEVSDTSLRVWFSSRDTNFRANLEGSGFYDEKDKAGHYSLNMNLPFIDFHRLNLISSVDRSILSGASINADVAYDGDENALGRVRIDNVSYQNSRGTLILDSMLVVSAYDSSGYDVKMRSPYFDCFYSGEDPLMDAVWRVKDILVDRQFGKVLGKAREPVDTAQKFGNDILKLKTYDIWKLSNVLSDGFYVSEGTELELTLSDRDSLNMCLSSGRIAKKNNYLRNLRLVVDNPDSTIRMKLTSSEMKVLNTFTVNNVLDINADTSRVHLNYSFLDNKSDNTERPMCLSTGCLLSRDKDGYLVTEIGIDSAVVFINDRKWILDPTAVTLGHKSIDVSGFRFHGQKAAMTMAGRISENPEDEFKVALDNLDLSLANLFVSEDMSLGGTITGKINIKDFYGQSHFLVDIDGDNVSFYDNPLGKLKVMSKWNPDNERMNLLVRSDYLERSPLNLTGYYRHPERELFLNASLDELSLTYAKPFLKDILRIDGGFLSGNIILRGSQGQYVLDSEDTKFVNFAFAPVFTNVPYLMNGGMKFTEDRIDVSDIEILDKNGNKATISGEVSHNFLKDMELDLRLTFHDMECLDIPEAPGVSLYGTATASGAVAVTGPVNDILIDALVKTGDNTSIHVPISNSYAAATNDILVFTDHSKVEVDPYDSIMTVTAQNVQEKGRVRIKADATLYDDALVTIELDKNLGNIVECHGNARVNLDFDPATSKTEVRGEYSVTSGMARYSFAGIIARDFSLIEGGTITFRGPLSNINLDLGATYKTKTSISTLIADTTSVGTRRAVYASVGLKGNLTNPSFRFKIDIPDIDPLTKGKVEAALSTEAKVQKQFMALMLTGSFIQDEQSGVNENGNLLYSNMSEMISNHVNNVLRTLNVPLDIGLNYQRTNSQTAMFDVNLSYQAFNNRLILNGSVGNGNRTQNWSGNFEAQLKMDKRGKFRFSLFTRAADQYTNYIDNSQRNGFGFSFQDEFTQFKEIFMSRKKKEAWELELIEKARQQLLEEQKQNVEKEEQE